MQRNTKSEVTYLGNLYGEHIHSGYAGAVFDGGGVLPYDNCDFWRQSSTYDCGKE